jgi:hypothetical protein
MGALVEQPIPTLFGGVSTQPAPVRKANQTETGDNAMFSIFTGGFEKRPGTQLINELTFLNTANEYAVHPIDRDAANQYFLLVADSEILAVNAITGAQVTVTVGDSTRYFLIDNFSQGTSTGVLSYSPTESVTQLAFDSSETSVFWEWEMDDAVTGRWKIEGSADNAVWNDIATGKGGAASGSFSTTLDAVATGDHNYIRVTVTTGMAGATDGITLKGTFKDLTYLRGVTPETVRLVSVADATFITNTAVTMRMAQASKGTVTNTKQTFSDLAAPTGAGTLHRVTGTDTSGFGTYYVIDDTDTSTYIEIVDPNGHNTIDPTSMPHKITFDGSTFTYSAATWTDKAAGDDDVTPPPNILGGDLVDSPYTQHGPPDGLECQDVNFFRNRLVLLADEQAFCTQAGDVKNVWPEKAVEVLDSDPVERAATTNEVNILKFCAVFRKILFATSQRAQFELTANNAFTPESATFDQATSYSASPVCPPTSMGDVLYFASKGLRHALVYEYFFDDATLSNTAADITAHVEGYIPNDLLSMVTDPTESTVFCLTTAEQNNLYVYKTFFDGTKKLQSSWAKYILGASESDAFIHGMATMSGYLVILVERLMPDATTAFFLEQMPIEREEQDVTVGFTPFLDQREVLSGTYDSGTDCTRWTTSYAHNDDVEIVLGPAATEPGREITPLYPDKYTLTLATVLAGETFILNGQTYTAHATTTTTANREFSISGNDIADAGELATTINDATDGSTTVDAVDNGDATITLTLTDRCDVAGITTPTGTAITNTTIVATEVNDELAITGDISAGSVWAGVPYTLSVQLSEFFFRDGEPEGKPVITGRLQMRDITLKLETTGYVKATVVLGGRTNKEFTFEGKTLGSAETVIGSASIASSTTFKVPIWANSEFADVVISSDRPTPVVITSAAWRGFFNEITRQE